RPMASLGIGQAWKVGVNDAFRWEVRADQSFGNSSLPNAGLTNIQALLGYSWGIGAPADSDGDGVPDRVEIELGLNPQDPADAKGDLDSDGFSNIEELSAKPPTDPKDPKSHPAVVNLLRVKELRGKRMPLVFSAVNKMPDGKYQIVFNQIEPTRRTYWVRENEKIDETGFMAGTVTVKSVERENPNMPGIKMREDASTVTVKRLSDNKEVTLKINESGKVTDVEAVIVLPLDNAEYSVVEGGTLKVREETFRVLTVDSGKTSVTIENEASGQQKVIPKLD
ncbi:MAG: Amuc_1099 family pilus-like system protein, partial [Kiritimatiellia bacterium]